MGLGASHESGDMGSAVAVAVAISNFNGRVTTSLEQLGTEDLGTFITAGSDIRLSPELQMNVRRVLSDGYNAQMLFPCGCGGVQALAAVLVWRN